MPGRACNIGNQRGESDGRSRTDLYKWNPADFIQDELTNEQRPSAALSECR